ncbi:MAG: exodeoxyribonuclease VII large subunit [Ruminococcaceae bacterium]|nr:exodeoxyribonuclease VII large subunit [Oscillospiraceae bacterium]
MEERPILSVSQVNLYIKNVLDNNLLLTDVTVKGEISNYKLHSSGHIYMSLKDETGVMRAVMFRAAASKLRFKPENGMKVIARGRVTVYERDGQYQLYINSMEQEGVGDLHVAFEKLKKKLMEEGLFDPAKKKPLPRYPKKVGVVTAPTGAAIRDIINILSRRFSYTDIVIYSVLVQGENSARSIVSAIEYFNREKSVDVMIVGRGGGSIEDLWSFNEEIVARAIYESEIPIVSAVGHEIDFTIADFVADLRAPTPSAAAELVVPSGDELIEKFGNVMKRLKNSADRILENRKLRLKNCMDKPVMKNPYLKLDDRKIYLDNLGHRLEMAEKMLMERKKQMLSVYVSKLDGLSPLGTVARGFSVATGESGVIKSVNQVKSGDEINVRVSDGSFDAVVK